MIQSKFSPVHQLQRIVLNTILRTEINSNFFFFDTSRHTRIQSKNLERQKHLKSDYSKQIIGSLFYKIQVYNNFRQQILSRPQSWAYIYILISTILILLNLFWQKWLHLPCWPHLLQTLTKATDNYIHFMWLKPTTDTTNIV